MSLLDVRDLDVRHGLMQAVRGVSFSIERGDVLAFVGANGAGKSTLLRAIAGAHLPAAGEIRFAGEAITMLPSHRRVQRGIALVPEGRRLFSKMTVEENLLLGLTPARQGPWTVEKVFELFPNLNPRRDSYAANLSGGEQQATAIGRALVSNPDLLLLDEVSLGLSPAVVDRVYAALPAFREAGATVVLVEQDLSRVLKEATRVICMLEGSVVLDRPVGSVTRDEITEAYFGLHRGKSAGSA
jgi:branched-chain amino acid transport system ATP-binding protein